MLEKNICHVGAWGGNYGDSVIQASIKENLSKISPFKLNFDYLNCQRTEFNLDLIERINKSADILIIGGGGLIFHRPQDNSKSGWQWNIEKELIEKIKIPFVIYGIGYNKFEYDDADFLSVTNSHLAKTVELASLFSVRNNGTKRELVKRGCNPNKIEVVPDSGMFLSSTPVNIPGLDVDRLKIGFNWTTDRQNQTFPEPWKENRDKFVKLCLESLNYAIDKYRAQVVYIGHMGGTFDSEIIDELRRGLKEKLIVTDEVLPDLYFPSMEKAFLFVDIYRQMDLVVGMRGHANIVAFGQNVPMIGIGSHGKVRYFLDDIGRGKYFFDVRSQGNTYDVGKMNELISDVIENNSRQKLEMRQEFESQKLIFDGFNKKVIGLFN